MKRYLITGANGLLGQKLVSQLAQRSDVHTIATGRGSWRGQDLTGFGHYTALDITDHAQVLEVIEAEKPDVIIHTAAMTNVDQCETEQADCRAQNVDAVQYLTEAANLNNCFLLHLSTDFIFDGKEGPYDEEAVANPLSFYGHSKADAEQIVLTQAKRWAIARTVLVYGIARDMSRSNIILWVKKSLEDGKSINVVTDQWRTPTLAEDLAAGCLLIADKEAEGIWNISGEEMMTPFDMAMATADYFGLDKALISAADSSNFKQPAQRPPRTGFIITKAQTQLGYRPHSFREGIAVLAGQLAERVV